MADNAFAAWVEVLPDFSQFNRKASSEMSSILGAAGTAGGLSAGRNIGDGLLGGIRGIAGPLIGAVAALGIGKLIGDAIGTGIRYTLDSVGLASDLSETKSAITQVFGDAAADIQSYADNANESLGQTRQAALQGAQTFGVFGKSAGLTGKGLSTFSTGLVGLSADLASFFNTSPAEAIDAIGAGLRGEAEPLRRFGVLLDDATLRSRALSLGIYDGNGALTSQQRILAAQAEIYAQTSIAQGDFERTSGGLANQQRILEASLQDTQTKLGEALLPAFTDLVIYANESLIPKLDGVIQRIGPGIAAAVDEAGPKLEQLIDKAAPLAEFAVEKGLPFVLDQINAELSDQGLIGGLPMVFSNLQGFQTWLTTPIGDTWLDDTALGFENFFNTGEGVVRNGSERLKAAWVAGINDTVRELMQKGVDWVGVGERYGDGLAEGFRNKKSTVNQAAADLAGEAVRTVANAWDIRSPSRVAAALGGYLAEGFALGITGGSPLVDSAMQSMVAIPNVPSLQLAGSSAGAAAGAYGGGDIYVTNPDPYVAAQMVKQELLGRQATG